MATKKLKLKVRVAGLRVILGSDDATAHMSFSSEDKLVFTPGDYYEVTLTKVKK